MAKVSIFLHQEEVSGKLFMCMYLGCDNIDLKRVKEGNSKSDHSLLVLCIEPEKSITS